MMQGQCGKCVLTMQQFNNQVYGMSSFMNDVMFLIANDRRDEIDWERARVMERTLEEFLSEFEEYCGADIKHGSYQKQIGFLKDRFTELESKKPMDIRSPAWDWKHYTDGTKLNGALILGWLLNDAKDLCRER